ncbi:hypothetical protein HPB50_011866 [Hyalomma asiaticum]|uniref:Uncharacterized protein n=1 Tax=Hyalomma asiaticum TaxID=266040 RepID=A0ACB7STF9_HYAAI|nr:hypothetical protein HPB50_011866 [Hyalomma asiaticum]
MTRWRIVERTTGESPAKAERLVKALCVLQNVLTQGRTGDGDPYCGPGYAYSVNGLGQQRCDQWRELAQPTLQVARKQARHFAQAARDVRDLYVR